MRATPYIRSLCCVPVEGAVTALGYFQASVSVLGILFFFREIVTFIRDDIIYGRSTHVTYATFIKQTSLWLLTLGLTLVLAIYLLVGVKKRRPGNVLTYLVIGLLAALSLTGYWLFILLTGPYYVVQEAVIEGSLALLVYSLCLVMVYLAYRKITLENSNNIIYNMLQADYHYDNDATKKAIA